MCVVINLFEVSNLQKKVKEISALFVLENEIVDVNIALSFIGLLYLVIVE